MMGKKFLSEVLSIGSDILAIGLGQPEIAFAGNTAAGAMRGGLKGAVFQDLTNAVSMGLAPEFGQIGSQVFGSTLGPGLGSLLGTVGGEAALGKTLDPAIASVLGLGKGQVGQTPPAPTALGSTPSTATPMGGPGLASGIPSSLNISGSTAPQIAPWFKPDKLPGAV